MAKKKMTPAQAAAARRPDDWEAPEPNRKPKEEKPDYDDELRPTGLKASLKKVASYGIPFIIAFVVAGIVAPFLVIFFSNLFGIK